MPFNTQRYRMTTWLSRVGPALRPVGRLVRYPWSPGPGGQGVVMAPPVSFPASFHLLQS